MENEFSKTDKQGIKKKLVDDDSYNNYWALLDKIVGGKKKIFVSLDGVYNQININTLKKKGGDYLINSYDIVLLGNPKDILADDSKKKNTLKNATLIGYPDFGSDRIPELPSTQLEVDEINKVLKASGYNVTEFTQKEASETNLKQTKKVSILHIATHGYFLEDVEKTFWPIGVHADNIKDNVLLRSGLMLAGATADDRKAAGLDSVNNGIITSYEAMNLDLDNTHLVVLSACETGLGEIKAGEGVYGLQRAFLTAGAEALLMSLWKVDDAATQQLMNNFYNNWIKNGDMQKAFRQAQLELMTKYREPYYWGAFVLMGN
jgi:CHAT domain-containing protein